MARYIRNTAILAKIEVTYKTDPVPTGAANAMLVSNMSINPLNAQNVDRALIRPWLGASEQLVGVANKDITFDVELAGSGAAGTAPAFGPLLRACALAEAVTASTRVDYTPISTAFEGVTIYYYDDGVLHKLLGCRGDWELAMGLSQRPVLRFHFIGIDGGDTAATPSGVTYALFQKPLVITDTNTGDITLGCTYSAGALSGGTVYTSTGLPSLKLGNSLAHNPLLGGEEIDITQREVTGNVQLDLSAAQEVTLMATVKANTTQGLGFVARDGGRQHRPDPRAQRAADQPEQAGHERPPADRLRLPRRPGCGRQRRRAPLLQVRAARVQAGSQPDLPGHGERVHAWRRSTAPGGRVPPQDQVAARDLPRGQQAVGHRHGDRDRRVGAGQRGEPDAEGVLSAAVRKLSGVRAGPVLHLPTRADRKPRKKLRQAAERLVLGWNDGSEQSRALAALGVPVDTPLGEGELAVWPENSDAVEIFSRMTTQWNYAGMAGVVVGLRQELLPFRLRMQKVPRERWPAVMDDVLEMERAALAAMRKKG
jgi:hypothetical protein